MTRDTTFADMPQVPLKLWHIMEIDSKFDSQTKRHTDIQDSKQEQGILKYRVVEHHEEYQGGREVLRKTAH